MVWHLACGEGTEKSDIMWWIIAEMSRVYACWYVMRVEMCF